METSIDIRLDWDYALEHGDVGYISSSIGWGFTIQDLLVLGALHKAGRHRDKIIDLLEDCNFHTECSLLYDGNYDKYQNIIFNR